MQVTDELAGGFSVSIENPIAPSVVMPDLFQLSPAQAAKERRDAGLVPYFSGPNRRGSGVSSQSPVAGHLIARGSTVTMVLRTGPLQ